MSMHVAFGMVRLLLAEPLRCADDRDGPRGSLRRTYWLGAKS